MLNLLAFEPWELDRSLASCDTSRGLRSRAGCRVSRSRALRRVGVAGIDVNMRASCRGPTQRQSLAVKIGVASPSSQPLSCHDSVYLSQIDFDGVPLPCFVWFSFTEADLTVTVHRSIRYILNAARHFMLYGYLLEAEEIALGISSLFTSRGKTGVDAPRLAFFQMSDPSVF